MILLAVWITLPDGEQARVGELACSDPDDAGVFGSEFEYAPSWLEHRQRFPLDPVSLPLGRGRFPARNIEPPLGVFDDALPDDWGRALIVRNRRLPRGKQGVPFLLRELAARHGPTVGALQFAIGSLQPVPREPAGVIDLVTLAAAADAFEAGLAADPHGLRLLFAAGSSLGGARPKALVSDGELQWIAKLPSAKRDGRFDVVGLEAVGLDLAARAGLVVPSHELRRLGKTRRRALLVERFDTVAAGGRRHMISLRTLCRERPGAYAQSYSELAEALRRVSAAPQEDVDRLYRQMAFNAAFGNTDDHLKNFWMLTDRGGYRLSPAFDLLPDVGERREHTLAFEYGRGAPTRTKMLALAMRWNVQKAESILASVLKGVAAFATTAKARGVPAENIAEIGRDIDRRVKALDGG
ncbi:MAG: type II toxin-antitoxin system HipA family toxin [Burkholderiales bacterium]|nr:type II toxin-antitoxin system HipA family toxin [Burkholderiales bacterium]